MEKHIKTKEDLANHLEVERQLTTPQAKTNSVQRQANLVYPFEGKVSLNIVGGVHTHLLEFPLPTGKQLGSN
ncbi:hypothetical protein CR513_49896, partial [Mucuna pruriens]